MQVVRHLVTVAVDASGDGTDYSPVLTGSILAIHYVPVDYASGVDFTITGEATGETIWTESNVNAAKSCAPRMATHSNLGAAALYAAGGAAVGGPICLASDRVKIVVAQGGVSKSGKFHIIVG